MQNSLFSPSLSLSLSIRRGMYSNVHEETGPDTAKLPSIPVVLECSSWAQSASKGVLVFLAAKARCQRQTDRHGEADERKEG
jgi:hypothetical protein